jgi:LAS superfamily LD-carboxypeptidase LdcB
MNLEISENIRKIAVIIIFVALLVSTGYLFLQNTNKAKQIALLGTEKESLLTENIKKEQELLKVKAESDDIISNLSGKLSLTKDELDDIERDLRNERDKNEEFEDQIRDISGTVKDLDKLSKTDEELLQKYSRTYFLNENFIPMKLSKIRDRYIMPGKEDQYFHGNAIEFLEDLLNAAKKADHDLRVVSAYRSFDEQQNLKGQFTQVYGSGSNAFSADQGYSEHQLGTTLDIVDVDTRLTTQDFANTEAYEWLTDNAYRYGFVLSYPKDNDFYIFEPWHWRFVGVDLARDLHRKKDELYEWDQRKIDEYLIKIFD